MAIVAFWGNSEKETGQTISMIAVSTLMSIEHNHRILMVSTGFREKTMEESFWSQNEKTPLNNLKPNNGTANVQAGIEGLSRILQSNRGKKGIIPNYTKVVYNGRLDVLPSPTTRNYSDYVQVAKNYPPLMDLVNADYNITFVDVDKRMPGSIQKEILMKANVIVINISQTMKSLEMVLKLKEKSPVFQKNNIVVLLGRYDKFSKYNEKNIQRMFKNESIIGVPYNTLFFEATTEATVDDYFLKCKMITDKLDRNYLFMEEVHNASEAILNKIREVQMRR